MQLFFLPKTFQLLHKFKNKIEMQMHVFNGFVLFITGNNEVLAEK